MEPQPGLFVTSLSADTWEPDPEVGGLMSILCDVPGTWAGFTRFDSDPEPVVDASAARVIRDPAGRCSDRDRRRSDAGAEGR